MAIDLLGSGDNEGWLAPLQQQAPFLSQQESSNVLDLLGKDRKLFLQVLSSAGSLELFGVMLILLRFYCDER
ncbi:hypothetical protein FRC11_014587, partial [Ceratobasidium sp. 423]